MRATGIPYSLLVLVGCLLVSDRLVHAHTDHMSLGRTADGRLTWHPTNGVANHALTPLAAIPPGGPLEGFSATIPGFGDAVQSEPDVDVHPLAVGANVWLEIVRIDDALLMIETPSFVIINLLPTPEMRLGAQAMHNHPIWLIDTDDPAYDPSRCVWEVTFVLKDKGMTQYADSELITLRFSRDAVPAAADFDCDGDVDDDDYEVFQNCATGAEVPYDIDALPTGCDVVARHAGIIPPDLDVDGDVDQSDFGVFQRCISGENIAADPACGEGG